MAPEPYHRHISLAHGWGALLFFLHNIGTYREWRGDVIGATSGPELFGFGSGGPHASRDMCRPQSGHRPASGPMEAPRTPSG
jgi:hypothetical protein